MKKIFTIFSIALTSLFATAQVDMSIDEIFYNTRASGEYLSDNAGPVSIVWSNQGPTIPAGDTIFLFIRVNGAVLTAPGFLRQSDIITGEVDTFTYDATTTLPQQQFVTTYSNLNLLGSPSLSIGGTQVGPNRQLSAFPVVYPVGGGGTPATDSNPANDTATLDYTLVDGDFTASNLQVVSPQGVVNANDEIDLGNTIDTVSFEWTNRSPLNLYDYLARVEVNVNGNLDTVSVVLPRIQDTYGSFTGILEGTGGQNTLTVSVPVEASNLPTTAGAFDICVRSIYGPDVTPADNETCKTYTYIEDSSVSVNEIEAESFNAFHAFDALNVRSNFSKRMEINITNINGQLVYNGFVDNGLNTIQLDQPAGIYIVTVGDNQQKVVIK
jgi:hypothetical protein